MLNPHEKALLKVALKYKKLYDDCNPEVGMPPSINSLLEDTARAKRPIDKFGQPIWSESRVDTLRRAAWIKAAENLITHKEEP